MCPFQVATKQRQSKETLLELLRGSVFSCKGDIHHHVMKGQNPCLFTKSLQIFDLLFPQCPGSERSVQSYRNGLESNGFEEKQSSGFIGPSHSSLIYPTLDNSLGRQLHNMTYSKKQQRSKTKTNTHTHPPQSLPSTQRSKNIANKYCMLPIQ